VLQARPGGPEGSLRRTALGETIFFEGHVWVRTSKAPLRMGLTGGCSQSVELGCSQWINSAD
jgi:hypothetical protein